MSQFPQVTRNHKKRSKYAPDQTNTVIRKMKTEVPVLSTILDYGGKQSIDTILHVDEKDRKTKIDNKFQRLLKEPKESSAEETKKQKNISYLEYKSPKKVKGNTNQLLSPTKSQKKELKSSIVVEMPHELKVLRSQIISLPSIAHNRQESGSENLLGIQSFSKSSQKHRFRRVLTEQSSGKKYQQNKPYIKSMREIFTQFEAPELNCNPYLKSRYQECKKILQSQEYLAKRYKHFERLDHPPKRIINLLDSLNEFQSNISTSLDEELKYEVANMDAKRYDLVIKHEEEIRKGNQIKYMEKKRRQKIEDLPSPFSEPRSDVQKSFKLNSKGKVVFNDPKKNY